MADSQKYVAVANFSLNLDNGTKQIDVKKGDEMMFDGLYVECRGEKGAARSLAKVVGDWIKPTNGTVPAVAPVPAMTPSKTRNATGGRILESSEVSQDLDTLQQQKYETSEQMQQSSNAELRKLVDQYENTPSPTHITSRTTDDMADMRKEARVQVDNYDEQEVAKVSAAAKNGSEKANSEVTVDKQEKKKATVVSHEEKVVKKTNYSKRAEETPQRKPLKVDKDGSGVEVRKVKSAATHNNDVKSSTAESRREVVSEQDAVIETNYGAGKRTVVSSSTQTQLESDIIMKTAVDKPRREVIAEASQEGVVVRKVSKIPEEDLRTQDGITSRVTVSSGGEESDGEVTFSSNSDIVEGEATFSSSEDTVADLGGGAYDDGDIDVNDILDGK
jgi:hypothetical protein